VGFAEEPGVSVSLVTADQLSGLILSGEFSEQCHLGVIALAYARSLITFKLFLTTFYNDGPPGEATFALISRLAFGIPRWTFNANQPFGFAFCGVADFRETPSRLAILRTVSGFVIDIAMLFYKWRQDHW
jgi:hypothetical protein